MSSAAAVEAQTGKRRSRGGKPAAAHLRSCRLTLTMYPADEADLEAIASHWDVSLSTLAWGVLHEWLQGQRPALAELGELRGALRAGLVLALRDSELGPWVRGMVERGEVG
jgi:hypothetical protein